VKAEEPPSTYSVVIHRLKDLLVAITPSPVVTLVANFAENKVYILSLLFLLFTLIICMHPDPPSETSLLLDKGESSQEEEKIVAERAVIEDEGKGEGEEVTERDFIDLIASSSSADSDATPGEHKSVSACISIEHGHNASDGKEEPQSESYQEFLTELFNYEGQDYSLIKDANSSSSPASLEKKGQPSSSPHNNESISRANLERQSDTAKPLSVVAEDGDAMDRSNSYPHQDEAPVSPQAASSMRLSKGELDTAQPYSPVSVEAVDTFDTGDSSSHQHEAAESSQKASTISRSGESSQTDKPVPLETNPEYLVSPKEEYYDDSNETIASTPTISTDAASAVSSQSRKRRGIKNAFSRRPRRYRSSSSLGSDVSNSSSRKRMVSLKNLSSVKKIFK